jgi:hypothetical protein
MNYQNKIEMNVSQLFIRIHRQTNGKQTERQQEVRVRDERSSVWELRCGL